MARKAGEDELQFECSFRTKYTSGTEYISENIYGTHHANNKGADQTAQMRSLVSAFVIHFLERLISKLYECGISMFWIVSVAE